MGGTQHFGPNTLQLRWGPSGLGGPQATVWGETAVAVGATAVAVAAAAMSVPEGGLMRQAMAYRVKYRLKQPAGGWKKRMDLGLLGVHTQNRGGVFPSPETVQNLGIKLLQAGFSVDEANHEGVCVQELPVGERTEDPAAPGKPYVSYHEFNMANCGNPQLRTCFDACSDTLYGTLSHSHLLLVLLSLKTGAQWKLPDDWQEVFQGGGPLNMDAGSCG